MLKNLKVGKKLSLSFSIILLLLVISTAFSIVCVKNVAAALDNFYTRPFAMVNVTWEMKQQIMLVQRNIYRACSSDDLEITRQAVDDAQQSASRLDELFSKVESNFTGNPSMLEAFKSAAQSAASPRDQVIDYAMKNENAKAVALLEQEYLPAMEKEMQALEMLAQSVQEMAQAYKKIGRDTEIRAIALLGALAAAGLIISILLIRTVSRGLARPIQEIEHAAVELAKGNLKVRIGYDARDELGNLAQSMRDTVTTLDAYITDIAKAMGEIQHGNLDVSPNVEFKGDFIFLRDSILGVVQFISDTIQRLNLSAQQVAESSGQLSNTAQTLSQGASEQAGSIEELAATVNEISSQIQQNAGHALDASKKAGKVGEDMTRSNAQMEDMMRAMADISRCSGEIEKIIKAIEDIAFQTNILALNAAVEAARAGAAGKGFAVVADEVRNLASKSAEASKNTSALIADSIRAVENGERIASDTASILGGAVGGAKELVGTIDRISEASARQAGSVSQVSQAVGQISSVVQQNSSTAQQSAAASEELSSYAQNLRDLVARFHLKEGTQASASYQDIQ